MATSSTALNYEAIAENLQKAVSSVEAIKEAAKVGSSSIAGFNVGKKVQDVTINVIVEKLGEIAKSLEEIPDLLNSLNRALKEKNEAIEETIGSMTSDIENL